MNPYNLLFVINPIEELEGVYQYYNGGETICSRKITIDNLATLQNHGAAKCQKRIQTFHNNCRITPKKYIENLNNNEKSASQLLKEKKIQYQNITNIIIISSNSNDRIFEKLGHCLVTVYVFYSFLTTPSFF